MFFLSVDKWTVLILRELLLGSTRYSGLQRVLSRISPTLLSKRLKMLERKGLLVKKRSRGRMSDDELDVEFLMWDLQRRLKTDRLPDGGTVLCFHFDELQKHKTWWMVAGAGEVDLCTENPGREVDLYINTSVRTLVEIWHGDTSLDQARHDQGLRVHGQAHLARSMKGWLGISPFSGVNAARP